jgi:hypothetical protein
MHALQIHINVVVQQIDRQLAERDTLRFAAGLKLDSIDDSYLNGNILRALPVQSKSVFVLLLKICFYMNHNDNSWIIT